MSPELIAILVTWLLGAVANESLFSPIGIGRMLISALITGAVAFVFWWWQSRSTQKRVAAHEQVAQQLESDLKVATEEKERIAKGHVQLMQRVTDSERALGLVKEQLALLDQAAQPLFEAAKIKLIEALTHPHPEFQVPDELLKLTLGPDGYITPELAEMLKERETSDHPAVTPTEKLAAAILPDVVKLAAMEAKVIGPLTKQLVSSPAAKSEAP